MPTYLLYSGRENLVETRFKDNWLCVFGKAGLSMKWKMMCYRALRAGVVGGFLMTAGVADAEKPSILVTGAGEGMHFLIDPILEEKLVEQGYRIGSSWTHDLTKERLSKFNAVVLLNEKNTEESFDLLLEYVKGGGGLVCFFDHFEYATEFDWSLNKLLQRLNAEVTREGVEESDESRLHSFYLLDARGYYKAFRADALTPHPVTEGVSEIWTPFFHFGTMKKLGPEWKVIVRGSETMKTANVHPSSPPVMAVREYGKGRVALVMGHSSFLVNNGYHLAYDNGWCWEHGDGMRMYCNLFEWLGEPSREAGVFGGYENGDLPPLPKTGGFQILPVPEFEDLPPHPGVFGVYSTFSGGMYSIADYAKKARDLGLKFLMFTDRIRTREKWLAHVEECKAASGEDFRALPGVEFVDTWGGNVCFAANIDKWPIDGGYSKSSLIGSLLNAGSQGLHVSAQPKENPNTPWQLGGFNCMEVASYEGLRCFSGAMDWFDLWQNIPGANLTPVVSHRVWTLDDLEAVANKGFKLHMYSKEVSSIGDNIRQDLVPGFVSNGPVIERFWMENMVADIYEKFFAWQPGDVARIHMRISSPAGLAEVRLFSGDRVIRRFRPEGETLETVVEYAVVQEGSFYLKVLDKDGKTAVSHPLPTRAINFWNHIGSDRMNDYHNPILPDPRGDIIYKGERLGFGGLITFGYGWGDYCIFYHPTPVERFHPQGYETGRISAGLKNTRMFPVALSEKTDELSKAAPRRGNPFSTRDLTVVTEDVKYKQDENRRVSYSESLVCRNEITIYRYRYRPYGSIIQLADIDVKVTSDIPLKTSESLEVQLIRADYAGRSTISKLTYVDTAGEIVSVDYKDEGHRFTIGKGGYVTLSPDPYGLVAIYSLDRDIDVEVKGKVPKVVIGEDRDGEKLLAGKRYRARFLICEEAGGREPDLWEKLARIWGFRGKVPEAPSVTYGEYAGTDYETKFAAKDGGVMAALPIPEVLPNDIAPISVGAMNVNWSAGAYRDGRFYAGGIYKGNLRIGLDPEWLGKELFLGHPVIANDPRLRLEIREFSSSGLSVYAHNPTEETIETGVRLQPALKAKAAVHEAELGPREGKLIEWRL